MKRLLILSLLAFAFFSLALCSCSEKVECTTKPKFSKGEEVKFKASSFGKKAVVVEVIQDENCDYYYTVSYFTLWDTRRLKTVSELELK